MWFIELSMMIWILVLNMFITHSCKSYNNIFFRKVRNMLIRLLFHIYEYICHSYLCWLVITYVTWQSIVCYLIHHDHQELIVQAICLNMSVGVRAINDRVCYFRMSMTDNITYLILVQSYLCTFYNKQIIACPIAIRVAVPSYSFWAAKHGICMAVYWLITRRTIKAKIIVM